MLQSRCRSVLKALTLIEVLVAVAIFSLIGVVVIRLFGGGVVSTLFMTKDTEFNYRWSIFRSQFLSDVETAYVINCVNKRRLILEIFTNVPKLIGKSNAKVMTSKVEYNFDSGKLYRNGRVILSSLKKAEFEDYLKGLGVKVKVFFNEKILLGREKRRELYQKRELLAVSQFKVEEKYKKGVFCSVDKDVSF